MMTKKKGARNGNSIKRPRKKITKILYDKLGGLKMGEITITAEEYKNLIKIQARVEVFAEYVNASRYSVGREECATFLGFELVKIDDRESDDD